MIEPGVALQVHAGVARVHEQAAELDEQALDLEDALQDRGCRVDDAVLELVDAVVEGVKRGEVGVDDAVECEIEDAPRVAVRAVLVRARECGGDSALLAVGDRDAEVLCGKDADGVAHGLARDRKFVGLEQGEGVERGHFGLDALTFGAAVLDVQGMERILLGEAVEKRVIGAIELVPGQVSPRSR